METNELLNLFHQNNYIKHKIIEQKNCYKKEKHRIIKENQIIREAILEEQRKYQSVVDSFTVRIKYLEEQIISQKTYFTPKNLNSEQFKPFKSNFIKQGGNDMIKMTENMLFKVKNVVSDESLSNDRYESVFSGDDLNIENEHDTMKNNEKFIENNYEKNEVNSELNKIDNNFGSLNNGIAKIEKIDLHEDNIIQDIMITEKYKSSSFTNNPKDINSIPSAIIDIHSKSKEDPFEEHSSTKNSNFSPKTTKSIKNLGWDSYEESHIPKPLKISNIAINDSETNSGFSIDIS